MPSWQDFLSLGKIFPFLVQDFQGPLGNISLPLGKIYPLSGKILTELPLAKIFSLFFVRNAVAQW